MCSDMDVPFAGKIPITAEIVEAGDSGTITETDSMVNKIFEPIIKTICKTDMVR